jgi:hypothetical protein
MLAGVLKERESQGKRGKERK